MNKKTVKKTRPARRIFGRPSDDPGPQQTFTGEFQISPEEAPSPAQQSLLQPVPSSHSSAVFPPAAQCAANSGVHDDHPDRAGPSTRSQSSSSLSVQSASLTPYTDRQSGVESSARVGLAGRRRRSSAGHRNTHGAPTVPVAQAAGARYSRSRSSNTVAADMGYSPDTHAAGGPSSLPALLPDVLTVAVSSPRMPRQRPPSTPYSPYSPFSTDSSIRTPSSGSVGIRHQQTFELPDPSPTDTSPAWHYPSPSPAPHTPASLRDVSVPPSVASESSPFLGLLLGDFSPEMPALDGDGADFPPLTPDGAPVAAAMLPNFHGRPRSQSAAQFIGRGGGSEHTLFSSVRASQSSISVPELEGLQWPPGIFGLDSSPLATPDEPGQEEPALRSGARSRRPAARSPSRSPRRVSGF